MKLRGKAYETVSVLYEQSFQKKKKSKQNVIINHSKPISGEGGVMGWERKTYTNGEIECAP